MATTTTLIANQVYDYGLILYVKSFKGKIQFGEDANSNITFFNMVGFLNNDTFSRYSSWLP